LHQRPKDNRREFSGSRATNIISGENEGSDVEIDDLEKTEVEAHGRPEKITEGEEGVWNMVEEVPRTTLEVVICTPKKIVRRSKRLVSSGRSDADEGQIDTDWLNIEQDAIGSEGCLEISSGSDYEKTVKASGIDQIDQRLTRSASSAKIAFNAIVATPLKRQPKPERSTSTSSQVDDSGNESEHQELRTPSRTPILRKRLLSVTSTPLPLSQISQLSSQPDSPVKCPRTKLPTKSPYFSPSASAKKPPRSPGGILSCIPFPPLSAPSFGLLQEKLAHDPLKLLIGVTFLVRTTGKSCIPIFYKLMDKYPTAEALATAAKEDIVEMTRHLGLQNGRADKFIQYARSFLDDPPVKGKRYRVMHYPENNAHAGIKKNEVLDDSDPREGAWEIGHITNGPYAIDSWRIFCRDVLRGLAQDWNGKGACEDFQPEWMRVLPKDKELRAFLRWAWLREGWSWDAETGEREVASKDLLDAVEEERAVWEWRGAGNASGKGDWRILSVDGVIEEQSKKERKAMYDTEGDIEQDGEVNEIDPEEE
jgi:hypothetical protein